MFSGKIDVKKLRPSEVNQHVVADVNHLLKKQHGKAHHIDEKTLREHMQKSLVVVAWQDERVIGMGVLIRAHSVSHSFGSIHNLVVRDGYDILVIGMRILELLIRDVYDLAFIEAGAWLQNDDMIQVLTGLGFKVRPKPRYRLKLR